MYCQVVYICGCIPARIQHALAELPETLDETYQRTLREIKKADWEYAHRLFQFVAVASRPLHVEELAELLAFDFKAEPIPKFNEDWRLEDPADAVLSTCPSFLAVVNGEYPFGKVIQFAHFSVKEFLTSARLVEADDIIFRRYHISIPSAHTLAAQACLGILLHLDENVTEDSLKEWHLTQYAAEHWADHVRYGGVLQNVEDGLKQLFNPKNPHLAVCVWIHDPRKYFYQRAERPLSPLRTSLHYAALWGLHSIAEFLVIECSQNVRFQGFTDNVAPLHLASEKGHVKTALVLIDHGAGVMAQSADGETPLHLASQRGQLETARMLIERGADVTAQSANGETPLHLASKWGQLEVARMLIERGADVTAPNANRETPLHLALKCGQLEVACMLIEHDADVTAQSANGETPLHLASLGGQPEVARMLIERGADVTAQNADGETPLDLASKWGELEVARMLIKRGADVTAQNKFGKTPFHLAAENGHMEVARLLIEHGTAANAQNNDGGSPICLASQDGLADITLEPDTGPGGAQDNMDVD